MLEYYDGGGQDNDAWVAGAGLSCSLDPWTIGLQASHGHYTGTDAFSLTPNPGGGRDLNRIIATRQLQVAPGIMLDGELGYTWFHDTGDAVPRDQEH